MEVVLPQQKVILYMPVELSVQKKTSSFSLPYPDKDNNNYSRMGTIMFSLSQLQWQDQRSLPTKLVLWFFHKSGECDGKRHSIFLSKCFISSLLNQYRVIFPIIKARMDLTPPLSKLNNSQKFVSMLPR